MQNLTSITQSSSGNLTIKSGKTLNLSGTFFPSTSDGAALGSTSYMWSDLFLASGGVINFNNGDVTVTHSSNKLTVAGGELNTGANAGGVDVKMFGATSGCYGLYDASEDLLAVVQTNASKTGVERTFTVDQTMTGIGASAEAAAATLTSNVVCGTYANAFCGKINLSTAGGVTGLAGVICAELDMPGGACAAGTYSVYEAEINMPASYSGAVPINVFQINVWGDTAASFDDYGNLFEITGVTSGAAHIWYDHQGTAPANIEEWVRVRTPGGVRYLALYNAVA